MTTFQQNIVVEYFVLVATLSSSFVQTKVITPQNPSAPRRTARPCHMSQRSCFEMLFVPCPVSLGSLPTVQIPT